MTNESTIFHADELVLARELEQTRPNTKRMVLIGGSVIAGLVFLATIILYMLVQSRQAELTAGVRQRVEAAASARANVLETWLEGVSRFPEQLTKSELFKLFVAEVDLADQNERLPAALRNQFPYMQAAVTEFAKRHGVIGAYLVARDGRVYLASAAAPILSDAQRRDAQKIYKTGRRSILPLRVGREGPVLDIVIPFMAPQTIDAKDAARAVGAILVSFPAAKKLTDTLARGLFDREGERARLLQRQGRTIVEIVPKAAPYLLPIASALADTLKGPLSFGPRLDVSGNIAVFSVGSAVPGTSWFVVQEMNHSIAVTPLTVYAMAGIGIAFLGTMLIAAAFVAVWWRQNSEANRALAVQYHSLASRIQAQRRLLDSINNSIDERIGLKNLDGKYEYVNPAFANSVAHSVAGILGRDDEAIFGAEAARLLAKDDQEVMSTGRMVTRDLDVEIMSRMRYLTVSKSPFKNENDVMVGIVSVARDVTESVERKHKQEAAARATRNALVHAVEMHDPYLSGHSHRMGELCKAVGKGLSLSDEEVMTLEMAAMLSQIGKLAIPAKILAKDSRLTEKEIAVVQGHIDHAGKTLAGIDFGMPVADTVMLMHERLDGSGYPKGLKGEEINILGRVIAACDVYCARISPRAYRHTIPPGRAIGILEDNADKYDRKVVGEIRRCVEAGEAGLTID